MDSASLSPQEQLELDEANAREWKHKQLEKLGPWLAILFLFVGWELAVALMNVPEFILPRPTSIFRAMWIWREPIFANALQTLYTTVFGFFLAVVFGLLLGVAIGASSLVYQTLYPLLIGFNSVPKIAVVPLLVIWFGIGTVPAVITAFLISFFPIVVNVAAGIATTEPELRDVLRALGARKRDVLIKVGLPRSMPYFFASLKIAITVAFIGSIMSETVASNAGIGHLVIVASARFDVPLVFAGLLVTAFMGVAMYAVASVVEQRITGWSVRADIGGTTAAG